MANHTSHLDTALLLTTLPPTWQRQVTVGAAADYFFDAWWRAIGSALLFNTFPIERHGRGLSDMPGKLIEDGWSIVMFPEGTRSPDGWTRRFRPGAAALARQHGIPVVPVALRGSYAAMPRGRNWPAPGRPPVHVRYGRPVRPAGRDENTLAFNARISAAISALLDEDKSTGTRPLDGPRPRRPRPHPAPPSPTGDGSGPRPPGRRKVRASPKAWR